MKKMLIVVAVAAVFGCEGNIPQSTSDKEAAARTEQLMQEANSQIGMPAIVNFQEKKLAKMIFELRDRENYICYAYVFSQMTGEFKFLGKCLGYGLPYSVQFTNPEKPTTYSSTNGASWAYTLPQADPNGLFMPQGLSATWVMLLDNNGEAHPVYVEPPLIVSPFPLDESHETR